VAEGHRDCRQQPANGALITSANRGMATLPQVDMMVHRFITPVHRRYPHHLCACHLSQAEMEPTV
jgi:hypothetical protein